MCIFAGPVEQVSGTRIYTSRKGNRQFTAYQMEVTLAKVPQKENPLDPWAATRPASQATTAMILPVPIRNGTQVQLVDMSQVPDFFNAINQAFLRPRTRGSKGLLSSYSEEADDFLEVHNVGDYKVSVAYSIQDIERADPHVFRLGENAGQTLSRNYAEGYAFVIASLRKSGKISPLGYITEIPPALSDSDYSLFIPTRHEHGDIPTWDHFIYVGGPGRFQSAPGEVEVRGARQNDFTMMSIWRLVPQIQEFLPEGPSTRMRAQGVLANVDLMAGI